MRLTKNQTLDNLVQVANIILVPGSFYRQINREIKEKKYNQIEKTILKYAVSPAVEIIKLGNFILFGKVIYELMK